MPIERVYELFRRADDAREVSFITALIEDILAEPIAVKNKVLDHKLIKWKTYDFFTLLEPIQENAGIIKLRINLEYIRIMKEFVVNPYLEF